MIRICAVALGVVLLQPTAISVPFELVNRHIMIPVSVNGSTPLAFVLDTGDKFGILDLDRARQLNLALGQPIAVGGVGSERLAGNFVTGATFRVAGVPDLTQPIRLAIPLGNLAAKFGQDFDGIIGTDFIKEFVVELDYDAKRLTLHAPATFTYAGKGESIPIKLNALGHPEIEADVTPQGGTSIRGSFVIDIGSGGALSLHSPFVAEHHLPGAAVKTVKAMGVGGAGGDTAGRIGRVAALTIGRTTLARPLTLFSEDQTGAFANRAIAGNIGYDILRRFRVFLDYAHDRIIFEPTAAIDAPFDRPMTGITFQTETSNYHLFKVTGVLEDSPASEAGVHAGDIITDIDGTPAARLTLTAIVEMFERPAPRKITLRRGADTLIVTLTPRVLV